MLAKMVEKFGNKPFSKHQAQGFEHFVLLEAYEVEEEQFIKQSKYFHEVTCLMTLFH